MADRTQQILPGGQSSAPFTYQIPSSTAFTLMAVRATFDGTGAAGAFLPCVQLVSDAGVLMAQRVTDDPVAAGNSADVTFAPFLGRRSSAAPSGDTLLDVFLASGVSVLYKLDELSGSTAHDSSGNGWDATPVGGTAAPTWGQPAGPPGTPTAYFQQVGTAQGVRNNSFPTLMGDWTILCWAWQDGNIFTTIGGQGATSGFGFQGFNMGINSSREAGPSRAFINIGNGVGAPTVIVGDNALTPSTWYQVAATRSGSTVHLYVNGAQQTSSGTPTYASTSSVWVGNITGHSGMTGRVSWFGMWGSALTGGQIAAIYSAGTA